MFRAPVLDDKLRARVAARYHFDEEYRQQGDLPAGWQLLDMQDDVVAGAGFETPESAESFAAGLLIAEDHLLISLGVCMLTGHNRHATCHIKHDPDAETGKAQLVFTSAFYSTNDHTYHNVSRALDPEQAGRFVDACERALGSDEVIDVETTGETCLKVRGISQSETQAVSVWIDALPEDLGCHLTPTSIQQLSRLVEAGSSILDV